MAAAKKAAPLRPGRKAIPPEQKLQQVNVYLTTAQIALLRTIGGSGWLRGRLDDIKKASL